jgi:hypothetical protein
MNQSSGGVAGGRYAVAGGFAHPQTLLELVK